MIPFLTISTIPIHNDLNDFNDSHWRWSGRFWFPLATLIPICDDPQWFLTIRTLHDDSWQFGPFVTIPKSSPSSNDSSPPTARRFTSLRRRLCLESVSSFFFFFHFYVYLFRIKDWWEDKDWNQRYVFLWVLLLCSVLVCWLIKQFLFVVVGLCIN